MDKFLIKLLDYSLFKIAFTWVLFHKTYINLKNQTGEEHAKNAFIFIGIWSLTTSISLHSWAIQYKGLFYKVKSIKIFISLKVHVRKSVVYYYWQKIPRFLFKQIID